MKALVYNGPRMAKMLLFGLAIALAGCVINDPGSAPNATTGSDGPANVGTLVPRQDGDATAGQAVFRFETFGNEDFWTDAARMLTGVAEAQVTPLQAMQLGLSVDIEALDAATQQTL